MSGKAGASADPTAKLPELGSSDPPDYAQEGPAGRLQRAALRIFARDGFRGATTRAIAEEAGLNQALVHYYFGSKAALYRQVLRTELHRVLRHQTEGRLGVLPLEDMLATFPGRLVDWFRAHPEVADLLRRESGAGGGGLKEIILELGPQGPQGVRKRLNALQREKPGQQALALPVDHVMAFVLSLSYGLILIAPLLESVLKFDLTRDSHWKGLQPSLEQLLRHGISQREAS